MVQQRCFALRRATDTEPTACRFVGKLQGERGTVDLDGRTPVTLHHSTHLADGSTLEVWCARPFSPDMDFADVVDVPLGPAGRGPLCYPAIFRCTGGKVGTVKHIKRQLVVALSQQTAHAGQTEALRANDGGTETEDNASEVDEEEDTEDAETEEENSDDDTQATDATSDQDEEDEDEYYGTHEDEDNDTDDEHDPPDDDEMDVDDDALLASPAPRRRRR